VNVRADSNAFMSGTNFVSLSSVNVVGTASEVVSFFGANKAHLMSTAYTQVYSEAAVEIKSNTADVALTAGNLASLFGANSLALYTNGALLQANAPRDVGIMSLGAASVFQNAEAGVAVVTAGTMASVYGSGSLVLSTGGNLIAQANINSVFGETSLIFASNANLVQVVGGTASLYTSGAHMTGTPNAMSLYAGDNFYTMSAGLTSLYASSNLLAWAPSQRARCCLPPTESPGRASPPSAPPPH